MKNKLITTIILSFLLITPSFADFMVTEVKIKDNPNDNLELIDELEEELEKEKKESKTVIQRIYNNTDNSKELRELENENKELKEKIDSLEYKLDLIIKKLEEDDETPVKEDVSSGNVDLYDFPLKEELNKLAVQSLFYKEPYNANYNFLTINQFTIYNSRVSKAALKIMKNEDKSIKLYMKDLNIKMMKLYRSPDDAIAYREYIRIFCDYDKNGVLETVTIRKRVD